MYGNESWGKFPKVQQRVHDPAWRTNCLPTGGGPLLPYGQGRSYGDVCLNAGGAVVGTRHLNNVLSFDRAQGVLRAESGLTLEALLTLVVPSGWFIPVSPGTKFVSLGGAIANDIHGKNHHKAGTFGRHVRRLAVLRTNSEVIECSPEDNTEFFNATIAGLGLTGLILWVEVQLIPVHGRSMLTENVAFGSLDEFFEVSKQSESGFDYTVAWLDCVSSGSSFGRGIFMRGNHAPAGSTEIKTVGLPMQPVIPFDLPGICLNTYSVKAFNSLYYTMQKRKSGVQLIDYDPFFYPLDSVLHWNRIYGRRGFVQFQCVFGESRGRETLKTVLQKTVATGEASFLAVLKEFGAIESPGMLSFPRPGYTLCLDFAFKGTKTLELLRTLEKLVIESGGALYPAKDACMKPSTFQACYPAVERFKEYIDPGMSSSFWRRVMEID